MEWNITDSTLVVALLCSFFVADPQAIEQGPCNLLLLFAAGPLHVHKPAASRLQTTTHLRCTFIATHVHLQSMEEGRRASCSGHPLGRGRGTTWAAARRDPAATVIQFPRRGQCRNQEDRRGGFASVFVSFFSERNRSVGVGGQIVGGMCGKKYCGGRRRPTKTIVESDEKHLADGTDTSFFV
jgi:hypothetical protein